MSRRATARASARSCSFPPLTAGWCVGDASPGFASAFGSTLAAAAAPSSLAKNCFREED